MIKFLLTILCAITVLTTLIAQADEYIEKYDVDIVINEDRSLDIQERITVMAAGMQVKRGITRALPLTRILGDHGQQNLHYNDLEILKNGVKEDFHSENGSQFMTIYIGNRDIFLDPGLYTYTISYNVTNQVSFFEDMEEVYWNALGVRNVFEVNESTLNITLPADVDILQETAYTGSKENPGLDYMKHKEGRTLQYKTHSKLNAGAGFTFAIGFPLGTFVQPSKWPKYSILGLIFGSLAFLLAYYYFTWNKYGRDFAKPELIPTFATPDNLSPASLSYISKKGNSQSPLNASIVNLVTKGYIQVEKDERVRLLNSPKKFTMTKLAEPTPNLAQEEIVLMEKLFRSSDYVALSGTYNADVHEAKSAHAASLRSQYHAFIQEGNNGKKAVLPFVITIASIIGIIILFASSIYLKDIEVYHIILYVVFTLTILISYRYLIRQPTKERLLLESKIDGFYAYMLLTDDARANMPNAPEPTIGHFEEMFPYAVGLDADKSWSDHFENALNDTDDMRKYNWYIGSGYGSTFGRQWSSTSVQPPSPSSSGGMGSGGGGFSGGGGGGGGVGGW